MLQDNYIINLWNLPASIDIDTNRSYPYFKGDINALDLYLLKKKNTCPYCRLPFIRFRSTAKKKIKHILKDDSYGEIHFHARVYRCDTCNRMFIESIPLLKVEKGISISLRLKILHLLKDKDNTFKKVSELTHTSVTYVEDLFDRSINIKRRSISSILCIDEIYARRLTKTKYCAILYNPMNNYIVDCLNSRRINPLKDYFYHISNEELANCRYFVSDLNETYRSIKNLFFKDAIHAVDSFHVIKNLTSYLDSIRKRVMKRYESYKDLNDSSYWLLKTKYKMLFSNIDELDDKTYYFRKLNMRLDKYRIIEYMLKTDEDLKEAYYLKEEYIHFNRTSTYDEAINKIDYFIDDFYYASSEEMNKFGRILSSWKIEIVNSFIRVNNWRLSNGKMENANRGIKLIFSNAFGYSNFGRARNRIMYVDNYSDPIDGTGKSYSKKRVGKKRGPYKKKIN